MSKAGAKASRVTAQSAEVQELIDRIGLRAAARELYEREETARVENAKIALVRLLAQLGLPQAEPFVLPEDEYPDLDPHERVCVKIDDFLLNYGSSGKLILVDGRCENCDRNPVTFNVETVADLLKPERASYQRLSGSCWQCYRRESSKDSTS